MAKRQDVVFRGTKEGLYLILNDDKSFWELKEKIEEQLERAESFFQGADVYVDTGAMDLSLDEILDLQEILSRLAGLNLKKIVHGVKGGSKKGVGSVNNHETFRRDGAATGDRRGAGQEKGRTILHKGTLRSGTRIAHDGNVVVVGDVNPGAEVVAAGDIVIMGSLRGMAHAGAGGDTEVVVVAFKLAPTQLRISDVIGRPPENDAALATRPEVARLKDGIIIVEELEGTRWEGER